MRPTLLVTALLLAADWLVPRAAWAYIDPGSGSFVIQMIVAAVMGAGVTLKMYWGRIKKLFGGKTQDDDPDFDE